MKLKSQLRDSSLELLREIAGFWELRPDEEASWEDRDALAEHLYPRLQSPAQFKHAFERLEVSEREIVYFLALHGGELPIEEFARRAGLHDAQKLSETLDKLQSRGFVFRETLADEDQSVLIAGVPEPFVRLVELPPYWKGFLGHYLQELGLPELKQIAQQSLNYKFCGKKKQVLAHYIRGRLLDPAVLRGCLESQPAPERELFQQILQRNGVCIWRDLLDGGAQKKFNHARADLLEKLSQNSGLVYVWQAGPNKYNNMVMVPRDLSHVIQSGFRRDERTLEELNHAAGPNRPPRPAAGFRPNVILDNTHNLIRDLAIFLAHLRRSATKMLNNGGIGRNDLKKIVPLLSHNKTLKYVQFLALFAISRKLLIPVGEHWRVSKNAPAWLKNGTQAYREFYEFWLNTNEWNEEFLDGDVVHVDHYPQNLIGITEMRKLILRVLENVPTEAWIDFSTFAESLLPQVAIEIPGRFDHCPNEKSNRHTLLIMESIIAESLYWFGLVTLGVSDLDVAQELGHRTNESLLPFDLSHALPTHLLGAGEATFHFKPSATARQMFEGKYLEPGRIKSRENGPAGSEAQAAPVAVASLTVQPNLEIVVPPDFGLDRFYQLLAFTDVKKVDIMTTVTLSRESLRMGLEQGLTVSDIVEFFSHSSRKELPETVAHLIEECGERHGEVDVGIAGGYIMASDPMHVQELRANARIQRYIKDIFNDRLILLNRSVDLKKIVREIQKMGFLPHTVSDTLHVTGEGLFHVTMRPEELYELLAVLAFAQGLEEEYEGSIFENRIPSLTERLSHDVKDEYGSSYYIEPLLKSFRKNFEKMIAKRKDEEKRKLKKQVNRLLTRMPRASEPERYPGENPTSDPAGVVKLMKYAIEHEKQVKLHYVRSTGEEIDEVIEPESLQGDRLYAYCPDHDEHHVYSVKRVSQAAI